MGDMKSFEGLGSGLHFAEDEFDGYDSFWALDDDDDDDIDFDSLIPIVKAKDELMRNSNDIFLPETSETAAAIDPWTTEDPWQTVGRGGRVVKDFYKDFMTTSSDEPVPQLSTFSPTSPSTPIISPSPISVFLSRSPSLSTPTSSTPASTLQVPSSWEPSAVRFSASSRRLLLRVVRVRIPLRQRRDFGRILRRHAMRKQWKGRKEWRMERTPWWSREEWRKLKVDRRVCYQDQGGLQG